MKRILYWLILLFTFSACNMALPQAAPTAAPTLSPNLPRSEADVPRVSVEEAKAAFERGEAIIVDVRSTDSFLASHIPGAVSIPLAQIEDNPKRVKFDKAQWIITYCT